MKEDCVLRNYAKVTAEIFDGDIANVFAVNFDSARGDVVESEQQLEYG